MLLLRGESLYLWIPDLRGESLDKCETFQQDVSSNKFVAYRKKNCRKLNLHHEVTIGNHVDVNHAVQSQSVPACVGAMQAGGHRGAVPVRVPQPSVLG